MRLVPASLGGRLALGAALLIGVALIVAGIGIGIVLQRFVRGQIDQRLDAQIMSVVSLLAIEDTKLVIAGNADAPPFDRLRSGWYWQVTGNGQTLRSASLGDEVLQPPSAKWNWPDFWPDSGPDLGHERGRLAEGPGPLHEPLHFRVRDALVGDVPVLVVATAPVSALARPMLEALTPLVLSLLLLGLSLAAASLVLLRFGLRPLKALQAQLADVRAGRVSHVPSDQPSELMPLVGELNTLIDQNAEGLARARGHVANLGHALNTPLATLAVLMKDGDGDRERLALVEEMEARIRHHLGRARAAALDGPARARTEVVPRVADIADALSKIHAERRITFENRLDAAASVACEAQDFDEMLGNLLDNAFKWAKSRVVVSGARRDARFEIAIEDDGPGLPDGRMPEAMLPGRKLDESVPGHGFGLAITRELAELYGGSLALQRSPSGGLKAVLALPAAETASG